MFEPLKKFEAVVYRRLGRVAPTGRIHRLAFWLLVLYLLLGTGRLLPGSWGLLFSTLSFLVLCVLVALLYSAVLAMGGAAAYVEGEQPARGDLCAGGLDACGVVCNAGAGCGLRFFRAVCHLCGDLGDQSRAMRRSGLKTAHSQYILRESLRSLPDPRPSRYLSSTTTRRAPGIRSWRWRHFWMGSHCPSKLSLRCARGCPEFRRG